MMENNLPRQHRESLETVSLVNAIIGVVELLFDRKDDVMAQLVLDTATWGLAWWEQKYGLPVDVTKPHEYRRSRVRAKRRGTGTTVVEMLKNMAESFSNGEVEVEQLTRQYKIIFWFVGSSGIPPNMNDLAEAIREVIPAHIEFGFAYTYKTHEVLSSYTHVQLGNMTHGQVRREMTHQQLAGRTHYQLRLMKQ